MEVQPIQTGAPANQMVIGKANNSVNQPSALNKDLPADAFVKEGEVEPKKKSKKGLILGLGVTALGVFLAVKNRKKIAGLGKKIMNIFKKTPNL